jgi:hypothetical protein
MPRSINGFGTGLVKASRKRMIDDQPHFDAIEAVMALYLPIIPYKALHVVNIWQDRKNYENQEYQSTPLRSAPRIYFKAMLNGWGNGLMLFGGVMTAIAGLASMNMERAFNQKDMVFLSVSSGVVIAGVLAKLLWRSLDASDSRIKEVLGVHPYGISDPYYWTDEIAETTVEGLQQLESSSSLLAIADAALRKDERAKAMLCIRLAMRDPNQSLQARAMLDQLL